MLRNIINKLKNKKQKLESFSNENSFYNDVVEKTDFEITISKSNNIYKVEISDYIKLSDYCERMDLIDKDNIADSIFISVLFNSGTQGVNSGIYYVFNNDNRIYNILVNEKEISIAERTIIGEEKEERVLSFPVDGSDYHYFKCKHNKFGSSYDTRYFAKNGTSIPNLELTKEDFAEDINNLVCRLKNNNGIENIYDIDIIYDVISADYNSRKN